MLIGLLKFRDTKIILNLYINIEMPLFSFFLQSNLLFHQVAKGGNELKKENMD